MSLVLKKWQAAIPGLTPQRPAIKLSDEVQLGADFADSVLVAAAAKMNAGTEPAKVSIQDVIDTAIAEWIDANHETATRDNIEEMREWVPATDASGSYRFPYNVAEKRRPRVQRGLIKRFGWVTEANMELAIRDALLRKMEQLFPDLPKALEADRAEKLARKQRQEAKPAPAEPTEAAGEGEPESEPQTPELPPEPTMEEPLVAEAPRKPKQKAKQG
jgi:hypothetical protein